MALDHFSNVRGRDGMQQPRRDHTDDTGHFTCEGELVTALSRNLERVIGGSFYVYTKYEWSVGYRIADVAICGFHERPSIEDFPISFCRLSNIEMRVIAELLPRPLRIGSLSERLFVPIERLRSITTSLKSRDLIAQTRGGAYCVTEWRSHLPGWITTVEAKLYDWRGAIAQAAYYRAFADDTYVAMPSCFAPHEDLHKSCESAGLGLVLIGADGIVTQPVAPAKRKASFSSRRAISALQLLQYYLKERQHATSI